MARVQRIIGKSFQQRDIILYEFMVNKPKFNVLITGAMHGIEKEGGDAVNLLMNDIDANPTFYSDINIVCLPYWNPDGIANETYENAQDFSIGYSALSAVTPEFKVFWEYLIDNKYYPDYHIDNHNLDHWNRGASYVLYNNNPRLSLKETAVIANNTNTLVRHKLDWNQWTDLINYVTTNSGNSNYLYNKYWDLNDYLNLTYRTGYDIAEVNSWLAIRFDTISFVLEGVAPADYTNPNDPAWPSIKDAQFKCNKYMIDWVRKKHPELVESKCSPPYLGERLPINHTGVWNFFPDRFTVRAESTNTDYTLWSTATRYRFDITNDNQWTTAPLAYAIHNSDEEDLNTYIKWFGFEWTQGLSSDSYDTQVFHCTAADPWDDNEGDIPYQTPQANRNGYYVSSVRTNFSNYTIYPVNQFGGDALIHILEPMSQANMSAYQTLFPTLRLIVNDDFPVLRLINKRA